MMPHSSVQKVPALKIHQKRGEPILVMMVEKDAKDLIAKHLDGRLPEVIGDAKAQMPWTVTSSEIAAMQYVVIEMGPGAAPQQPWLRGGSGLN